MVGPRV